MPPRGCAQLFGFAIAASWSAAAEAIIGIATDKPATRPNANLILLICILISKVELLVDKTKG